MLFIKIVFASRKAINILSINAFNVEKTIKKKKNKIYKVFPLINCNLGENKFKPRIKKVKMIKVITEVTEKQVLIWSFFLVDLGKYLIKPTSKPSRLKDVIKSITDKRVVATPT